MSLTSCFKYVIELPESSMSSLLRSVIAQGETAGLPLTYEDPDATVDGHSARISATLVDSDETPSSIEFTVVDLEAILHLHNRIDVEITDLDGLDTLIYQTSFDLPGMLVKDTTSEPPRLNLEIATVTPAALNLAVSGGEFVFTPALFEPAIHELYDMHPEMHYIQEIGVMLGGQAVAVQVWLYDDDPGASDYQGHITVELPEPMVLRINIPGRMLISDVSMATIADFGFIAAIDIDIVSEIDAMGQRFLVVKLSAVTTGDIEITFDGNEPWYSAAIAVYMKAKIVELLQGFGDPRQPVPSDAQVREEIEQAIIAYATDLVFPLFPLGQSAGEEIDLSTAVPTTIDASVLALQIEQEPDVPCDGAENFTDGSPVAIAMSAREVRRRLDIIEADLDGTEFESEGYDITLGRPSAALADPGDHGVAEGHIWISGTAVVHVGGCVGDVDVDYWGPIMLDPITNEDGSIGFDFRTGEFGGDVDAKDKKADFDPEVIREKIENWPMSFPNIPGRFEGVGTITLNLTEARISTAGIVVVGGVDIQTLNMMMIGMILPTTLFWALEGPTP